MHGVVTFAVDLLDSTQTTTCQSNNAVAVALDLKNAIGNRELVDGECLPGAHAYPS